MYQLRFKRLLAGLFLTFLTGCSTVQIVRELPPPELLADCPAVLEQITTNGGLASTILDYRSAMAKCNIDKRSLREWANQE